MLRRVRKLGRLGKLGVLALAWLVVFLAVDCAFEYWAWRHAPVGASVEVCTTTSCVNTPGTAEDEDGKMHWRCEIAPVGGGITCTHEISSLRDFWRSYVFHRTKPKYYPISEAKQHDHDH